jgi:hypothetical protein
MFPWVSGFDNSHESGSEVQNGFLPPRPYALAVKCLDTGAVPSLPCGSNRRMCERTWPNLLYGAGENIR